VNRATGKSAGVARRAGTWLAGFVAVGVGVSACLLADPGPTLPTPPDLPPFIDALDVQPQPGVILTSLPVTFTVPITQVDTSKTYVWRLFVDYDPLVGTHSVNTGSGTSADQAASVEVASIAGEGCHVIQFIVAYGFEDTVDRQGHTPVAPGGDSVTWFYSPGGDLAGCTEYGGELDASFPDAGSDAGEAGTE
jgi:hypothetical protein